MSSMRDTVTPPKTADELYAHNQRIIALAYAAKGKISDKLHAEASALYQEMITKIRPILAMENDPNFGKTVVPPSAIWAKFDRRAKLELNLHASMHSPIYSEESGELLACSLDHDDQPISPEAFKAEQAEIIQRLKSQSETLSSLIDTTNKAIIKLAEEWSKKEGNAKITASDIYLDMNRRAVEEGAKVDLAENPQTSARLAALA